MKIIIVLVIMYGRGENSIAEQLGCSVEEARSIKNNVYDEFPGIMKFEKDSRQLVATKGYVTTLWGRKRRLPNYNLPNYSFYYATEDDKIDTTKTVPKDKCDALTHKLNNLYWKKKLQFIDMVLKKERIIIEDNNGKINDAGRQIINSRVQGCLDGNTKIKSKDYGIINIKDYVNHTLDIWDGENWTPGTIVNSGKKQKCIIHLDNGTDFICSPDHKFRVTLSNGSKIWKKCSELLPNDNIDESNF